MASLGIIETVQSEKESQQIVSMLVTKLCDQTERRHFGQTDEWRKENVPAKPGVYAFFEGARLVYVGEAANLQKRMRNACDTRNHIIRVAIARKLFGSRPEVLEWTNKKKLPDDIESKIDEVLSGLDLALLPLFLGRAEVESAIIVRDQPKFNTKGTNRAKVANLVWKDAE